MVDPGKIIAEIVTAFLAGIVLGLITSSMYGAMEAVLLSIAVGGLIGLILFFFNIFLMMDDVEGFLEALAKSSFFSLIIWFFGFIGSLWGTSMVT
jgi:hypothetical protein